jgi:hypothetical protein
MFLNFCLV